MQQEVRAVLGRSWCRGSGGTHLLLRTPTQLNPDLLLGGDGSW